MNYSRIAKYLFLAFAITSTCFGQIGDIYNRFRLGQSYEQSGDLQKARSIYEDLYKQQTDNYQFFEALNRVYTQLKNYDASILIIQQRLKNNPQDINMYGLLGSTYYLKGDEQKAFESWEEGIKTFPDKQMTFRVMANYAIEQRAFEKAIEILQRGKKTARETYNFSYDLANLYALLMKYKDAAEEFCQILLKDPSQITLIQTRLANYINKPEAQKQTIDVVSGLAKKTDDINLNILLGWIYMESGEYQNAYDIYLRIDAVHQNSGAELYNFAERALRDGHFEEASKAFKKIFESYPSSPFTPGAKVGYAKTLEAALDKKYDISSGSWKPFASQKPGNNGEYNDVISAYDEIIRNYDGLEVAYEAHYRIGLIKFDRFFDINGAEESFKQVVTNSLLSPFSVPSLGKLAEIAIIRGNLAQAQEYYDKITENPRAAPPDKNYASFMSARILFWNGNFTGASGILNNVQTNLNENYTNDAIELSLLINTTKNDSLSLSQFAEAELMAFQKKFKAASDLYSRLSKNENLLTIRDLSALRLAEMTIALEDMPQAVTLLGAISAQSDKNIYADKAVFLLAEVYQYGLKDGGKAIETYENLLAKFPNSIYLDSARENINELKNKPDKNL